MKIAVTGATGYIGQRFVKLALTAGHQIVALTRQQPRSVVCEWIPYELSSDHVPVLPVDTDVVLHFATSTSANKNHFLEMEVSAAELVITAAQNVGARFIFSSSQTARPDAPTDYGRAKWHIEQRVIATGGWAVRPGQVYGGPPRGMFGELVKTVQRLPILPAFLPSPRVQPIHVDDLVLGLLRIAERADIPPGVLCLASPEPVTFTFFMGAIARDRLRLQRFFAPAPTLIVSAGIRLVGGKMGLDRLHSLFHLPLIKTASDLARLDLNLRPLSAGMHPAGSDSRRQLLLEGLSLMIYVLRKRPAYAVLRRYVRAVETLRDNKALVLPKVFMQLPVLLALIDGGNSTKTAWNAEFIWRLDAATLLAETTRSGSQRFLGLGEPHGLARNILMMTRAILAETGWRILGWLIAPLTRNSLPRTLGKQ